MLMKDTKLLETRHNSTRTDVKTPFESPPHNSYVYYLSVYYCEAALPYC